MIPPVSYQGKDKNVTAHKIRTVTLYRGVSEAARRAGVSQSHLSRVLRGERKPGPALARKLARMGVAVGKS